VPFFFLTPISSQLGALSAEDLSAVPCVEEPAREPPMPKVRFRAV
jgi:hypothetical protein